MKYNLKDCTFIIPYYTDSTDRAINLFCILRFLRDNFETNIILVEEDVSPSTRDKYQEPEIASVEYIWKNREIDGIFYRTKVINVGIRAATTPYICIYDTDVVFDPGQLSAAYTMMVDGVDCCYPYAGDFVDIERSYITDRIIKEKVSFTKESVGGAVLLNRQRYIAAGMENEGLIGWGQDDRERYNRMYTLGYTIARVDGKCWHINHERGINSSPANPYTELNNAEYRKVTAMNKEELEQYIKGWTWVTE